MQSLQNIKEDLQFNIRMVELMEILKGITTAEYLAIIKRQTRFTRFMEVFNGFFDILDFHAVQHPFAHPQGRLAILVITSSEWFMGGLNARIINAALENAQAREAVFIAVGEKGAMALGASHDVLKTFPGVAVDQCYTTAVGLRDYIMTETKKGTFGRLVVYYPRSISFMVQRVEELRILPCAELFAKTEKAPTEEIKGLIVESSLSEMIQYLVETWIVQKLYEVLEDSKLAEFSARAIRFEESLQRLQERGRAIRLQYLRGWHELIDKDMRDIFTAQIMRRKTKRTMLEAYHSLQESGHG